LLPEEVRRTGEEGEEDKLTESDEVEGKWFLSVDEWKRSLCQIAAAALTSFWYAFTPCARRFDSADRTAAWRVALTKGDGIAAVTGFWP